MPLTLSRLQSRSNDIIAKHCKRQCLLERLQANTDKVGGAPDYALEQVWLSLALM
jgi:hypothetical protein